MTKTAGALRHTEIGLLLYPGCAMATVFGLTDAFQVGNDYAARHEGAERIRTSHWRIEADGSAVRTWESDPAPGGGQPDYVVVPGRLSDPLTAAEAAPFAGWL